MALAVVATARNQRNGRNNKKDNDSDEIIQIQDPRFELVAEDGQEMDKFLKWANKKGKNYKSSQELDERLGNWKVNNKTIRDFN